MDFKMSGSTEYQEEESPAGIVATLCAAWHNLWHDEPEPAPFSSIPASVYTPSKLDEDRTLQIAGDFTRTTDALFQRLRATPDERKKVADANRIADAMDRHHAMDS
jgi:hypothetical protein